MNRLVVIDDNEEVGRVVANIGKDSGYAVKNVSRVEDFKNIIERWNPTVIILDLAMPEMDGLELLRWLANKGCRVPIMIMSGYDTRVVEAARRVGQDRGLDIRFTLIKPVRFNDMREKLQCLIKAKEEVASEDTSDLERGMAAGELFLVYQSKIDLKKGSLRGVEALVRWRHPQRGIIPPDQFVPLAETNGLAGALTECVLALAIPQQKAWRDQMLDMQIAVNLSPSNLSDEQLVDRIVKQCKSEDVAPGQFLMEVTETAAMDNMTESLDALTRFRLKGFELAIDDFGTGFSSLARLQRLPVTEIKIDRSFVAEALASKDAYTIVRSIIGLAHNMNLTVVAEGIETPKHYQMLVELGCDLGQGYGIAKPMPASEIVAWHENWVKNAASFVSIPKAMAP